jgi:hypothetical protein
MEVSLLDRISDVNAKLRALLFRAREALAGRFNFGVEEVRAIVEPVEQMAPIVDQAEQLRTLQPDLDGELKAYGANLGELQTTLDQVRFMLIARRANLASARGHMEAVVQWAAALRQTR